MPFGGHRSKDKHKSSFADWNKFIWDKNGKLVGKVRHKRSGERYILPLTKEEIKEFGYKDV